MTQHSSPVNETDEPLKAAMDDMRDPEVASALRAEQAQQPASPVTDNGGDLLEQCARVAEEFCEQGRDGYQIAKAIRAIRSSTHDQCAPLPGLVSTLRSHADDCENEERWATPELAPLLRRAADVIEAGVSPVTSTEWPEPIPFPSVEDAKAYVEDSFTRPDGKTP